MLYEDIAESLGEPTIHNLQSLVDQALAPIDTRQAPEARRDALEVLLTATLADVIARRSKPADARRRAINCADMLEAGVLAALGHDDCLPAGDPTILAGTLH